jgi:hypothetical protein
MARNSDEPLALAIATGMTIRDAAHAAGVSERTAARRAAEPEFRHRVTQLRGDMVARASGQMADAMTEAATELRRLIKESKNDNVRLGACRAMVELGTRLRDTVELQEALRALEAEVCDLKARVSE